MDINYEELINFTNDKELETKFRKLFETGGLLYIKNVPLDFNPVLLNLIKYPLRSKKSFQFMKKTIKVTNEVKVIFYTN